MNFNLLSLCFGKNESLALALREIARTQFEAQFLYEELSRAIDYAKKKHPDLPESLILSLSESAARIKARVNADALYEKIRNQLLIKELKNI